MKKTVIRIILPLLVLLITVSTLTFSAPEKFEAQAATLTQQKSQLGVLKDKYSEAAKKTQRVRDELAKTKGEIKTKLQEKDDLDVEIVALTEQINYAKELIAEYQNAIADKETEKAALEKRRDEQVETLAEMLRTSYMYGDESYIDLILGSKDISDFLQRLDFISYHMKYSSTIIEEMELTVAGIEEVAVSLETTLAAMNELRAEYEAAKAELEPKLAQVDAIIAELQADTEYLEAEAIIKERDTAALEKDIKALEKQIAEKEAQQKKEEEGKKKKEAAKNDGKSTESTSSNSGGGGTGKLIWPIKGRTPISSSYGYRKDPFTGKQSFHNGIDIPAPHGTDICAADSGTVIRASRYDSYGECVMIDHGGGVITLYAHCSGYNVKVGQKVEQGDVIAFVGSTGRSTGNHLHFVVRVNGQYKNPSSYVK